MKRSVTRNRLSKPEDLILPNATQPISGNQRPNLLTALMNMSLGLRLPRKRRLSRSSSNVSFSKMLQNPHFFSLLARCRIPCNFLPKSHLTLQKRSEHVVFGSFLTSKCASCLNDAHLFDISTSEWSEREVFLVLSRADVLRAGTACTFSASQLLKSGVSCTC